MLADRLIAQNGGFTIQNPLKCLLERAEENFDEDSLDVFEIFKWILPKGHKLKILGELHRVSINCRTLFPSLDGVGNILRVQDKYRQVNWKSSDV